MSFAQKIDHTLLSKSHTHAELDSFLSDAEEYGTNVCVPPSRVEYVAENLSGSEIATVVGFPLGYNTTEIKVDEARLVVENGATEIDMACNISSLKSGDYDAFRRDVERVVNGTDVITKAIIETGLLSDGEKRRAAKLVVEAGADYVKTCTGFTEGKATVEDVELIKDVIGDEAKIKASGSISDYETAQAMLEAGADRIGASSGDEIVRGYRRKQSD
ncbi:MAG: deoxyribose-phosphate aldolase [Halobacteria archaeon]|nr:deoxyribose-phosphate aldolase [Halobacteria archaeon]